MKTTPSAPSRRRQHCIREIRFPARTSGWITLVFLLMAITAAAQTSDVEVPRFQFFGGYSYTRFDSSTFGFSGASNLNGWNVAASGNLIRGFGGTAELSGQYGNHMNLRDFAVGPQVLLPHGRFLFY